MLNIDLDLGIVSSSERARKFILNVAQGSIAAVSGAGTSRRSWDDLPSYFFAWRDLM